MISKVVEVEDFSAMLEIVYCTKRGGQVQNPAVLHMYAEKDLGSDRVLTPN